MHHKAFTTDGTLEERVSRVQKYLEELSLHRDSRKGLDGARGEKGEPGRDSVVAGPCGSAGRDGKDADITQVVEAALKRVREEFDAEYKILAEVVRHELKKSGVIDEDGAAILVPGPAGAPSTVAGAKGDPGVDGKSLVGPAGRDAKIAIGHVTAGEKASVSVRQENDTCVLDFILPRGERGLQGEPGISNIPGPKGDRGEIGSEGLPGLTGKDASRETIIAVITDLKARGFFAR